SASSATASLKTTACCVVKSVFGAVPPPHATTPIATAAVRPTRQADGSRNSGMVGDLFCRSRVRGGCSPESTGSHPGGQGQAAWVSWVGNPRVISEGVTDAFFNGDGCGGNRARRVRLE